MTKLIKSKERVKKFAEVFTPDWVVNDMLNMVADNSKTYVFAPEFTWLEPAAGTGNFVVEILKRKFANCSNRKMRIKALKSVYAVELLQDNLDEMKARIRAICIDNGLLFVEYILDKNIIQGNFLTGLDRNGKEIGFVDWFGDKKYHTLNEIKQQSGTQNG